MIPCKRQDKTQVHVQKAVEELTSLMKHWSHLQPENESLRFLIQSLDQLFDISVADLHYQLSISGNQDWKEDWQFYQNQKRGPQVGFMCGCDKLLKEWQQ